MIEEVEKLSREFVQELGDESLSLYERLPKGKRVRAKLILKIAKNNKDAIKLASIVELIHAASLLHDDVIDDATTRRGVESINAIYGNKSAIMLGDILYSKGYFELVDLDIKIAKIISDAVTKLSIGELMDVELSKKFNPSFDRYFDMIYNKTAVLIEASSKSAAIVANKDAEVYGIYGKNLGLAFQVIDDILDITQDSKTLGKPSMSDFKEGKTTLPYIYLYESMNEDERKKLLNLYKKELSYEEERWIGDKMREHGAIERAYNYASKLGDEALKAIEAHDESQLTSIMKNVIERSF
ncbi:MAG: polyprenyl synthetase family protein [Sulfurospirillum sp.]|nr:MAG: polyprenyl synthetase family protein [Sulfurospirillum sp.]